MAQVVKLRRKPGRPKVLDTELKFRLPWEDLRFIYAVAFYERRDASELMRMQVNGMRKQYRKDRGFRKWLERHKEDLIKQGIPPEEIF